MSACCSLEAALHVSVDICQRSGSWSDCICQLPMARFLLQHIPSNKKCDPSVDVTAKHVK